MAKFENQERRIDGVNACLKEYGLKDLEEALALCESKGFNPGEIAKSVQPIAFEDAAWSYTLGAAIAIKKGCKGG